MMKQAISDIDVTLNLISDHPDALLLRGKCSYLNGDPDSAFTFYKKLTTVCKTEYSAHFHAGNLLMLSGDFEAAIEAYKMANDIYETANSHYQLSKCLMILDKFHEAIKELEIAVSIKEIEVIRRDLESLKKIEEFILDKEFDYEAADEFFTKMINECNNQIIENYTTLSFNFFLTSLHCVVRLNCLQLFIWLRCCYPAHVVIITCPTVEHVQLRKIDN